eukprot:jgi/Botrbrau1/12762/Bobra.0238s0001.1
MMKKAMRKLAPALPPRWRWIWTSMLMGTPGCTLTTGSSEPASSRKLWRPTRWLSRLLRRRPSSSSRKSRGWRQLSRCGSRTGSSASTGLSAARTTSSSAGGDMQQNELLVKRHLRRGDLYVHAELHGASTTLIKNHAPDLPVPPLTIAEAGQACVCRSQAWEAKIVTSAWWVEHHQVSKTAPSGEYLPTGSFMIRGKKNFLPPHPLVMGFAVLFKLDESSLAGHVGERAPRSAEEIPDDGPQGPVPGAPADQEEFQEVEPASSSDEEDPAGGPSGSDSQNLRQPPNQESPQQATEVDPEGGTDDRPGDPGPPEGSRSATPGEAMPGSGAGLREPDGEGRGSAANPNQVRGDGDSGAAGQGNERNAAASSALEEFLEGGLDALASRKPAAATSSFQRYNLEVAVPSGRDFSGEEGAEALNGGTSGGPAPRLKHLSAKQRKLMKQGKMPDAEAKSGSTEDMAAGTEASPDVQANGKVKDASGQGGGPSLEEARRLERERREARKAQAEEAAAALAKGKKGGKAKKSKEKKYADQDEEDRQLAMQVLASAGQQKDRKEKKALRKEKLAGAKGVDALLNRQPPTEEELAAVGAQARIERKGPWNTGTSSSGAGSKRPSVPLGPPPERPVENQAGAEEEEPPVPDAHQTEEEKAEIAALLAEEKVELLPEEELMKLRELDSLTGIPREGDVLLHALPVCAPYTVLQGYKYKVKLTPGTQRKGRAARQALEILIRSSEATQREKEVMKAIPEMEAVSIMQGNVRLSIPGLAKIKTEQRRQKKGRS